MHPVAPSLVGAALAAFPALAPAGCDSAGAPVTARSSPPIHRRAARPARIVIPAIGGDAPLIALRLDAHGALAAPAPPGASPRGGGGGGGGGPGGRGPAVIDGHVDSKTGPAVFYRLPKLR